MLDLLEHDEEPRRGLPSTRGARGEASTGRAGFFDVSGRLSVHLQSSSSAVSLGVDEERRGSGDEGEDDGFDDEHGEELLVDDTGLKADVQDDEFHETVGVRDRCWREDRRLTPCNSSTCQSRRSRGCCSPAPWPCQRNPKTCRRTRQSRARLRNPRSCRYPRDRDWSTGQIGRNTVPSQQRSRR